MPTPYSYNPTPKAGYYNIEHSEGGIIGRTTREEEAEFIVQACNSHYALVKALNKAKALIGQMQEYMDEHSPETCEKGAKLSGHAFDMLLLDIPEALALSGIKAYKFEIGSDDDNLTPDDVRELPQEDLPDMVLLEEVTIDIAYPFYEELFPHFHIYLAEDETTYFVERD